MMLLSSVGCAVQFGPPLDKSPPPDYAIVHEPGPGASSANVSDDLYYIEVNESPERNKLLIFVHGSPGSWIDFAFYLKDPAMQKKYHMVAINRLGWNQSDENSDIEIVDSLTEQASAIASIIGKLAKETEQVRNKDVILMGHSYGGAVIAQTAMDYPELVQGLVFIAALVDPELSAPRWYNRVASVLPRLLLGRLKYANSEMKPLVQQLSIQSQGWQKLELPVLIIQGDSDRLVAPANALYIENSLVNATELSSISIKGAGHYLLWYHSDKIRQMLMEKF